MSVVEASCEDTRLFNMNAIGYYLHDAVIIYGGTKGESWKPCRTLSRETRMGTSDRLIQFHPQNSPRIKVRDKAQFYGQNISSTSSRWGCICWIYYLEIEIKTNTEGTEMLWHLWVSADNNYQNDSWIIWLPLYGKLTLFIYNVYIGYAIWI